MTMPLMALSPVAADATNAVSDAPPGAGLGPDLNALWQGAWERLHALNTGTFRGQPISGKTPADVDAWVKNRGIPGLNSVADLQQALAHQEAANATPGLNLAETGANAVSGTLGPHVNALLDAFDQLAHRQSFRQGYANSLNQSRAMLAQAHAAHPALTTGIDIAGSVPAVGALAEALPGYGAGFLGRLLEGAQIGGATGAVQGATSAPDVGAVPGRALKGGLYGGLSGGVTGVVAKPLLDLGADAINTVRGTGNGYLASPLSRSLRALLGPEADAQGTALADLAHNITPARMAVLEQLRRDAPQEAMGADVSPQMTQTAASGDIATGDQLRAALRARNAGAAARMQDAAAQMAPTPGEVPPQSALDAQLEQEIQQHQESAYKPLEAKYPILDMNNPAHEGLFATLGDDPYIGQSYGNVLKQDAALRREQLLGEQKPHLPSFTEMQATLGDLQGRLDKAYLPGSNQNNLIQPLSEARDLLKQSMEEAYPEYATANQGYAALKQAQEASAAGSTLLRQPLDAVRSTMASYADNPRALDAARSAAAADLYGRLGELSPTANAYREAMASGNKDLTQRFDAIFGHDPEAADAYFRRANAEQVMRGTNDAVSATNLTAPRTRAEAQLLPQQGGLLNRTLSLFKDYGAPTRQQRVSAALGQNLLAQGPALDNLLQQIADFRATQNAATRSVRLGSRVAAGVAGPHPAPAYLAALAALRGTEGVGRRLGGLFGL